MQFNNICKWQLVTGFGGTNMLFSETFPTGFAFVSILLPLFLNNNLGLFNFKISKIKYAKDY